MSNQITKIYFYNMIFLMARIIRKIIKSTGRFFCNHSHNRILKGIIQSVEIFHNNIENVNFNSKTNGEEKFLRKIQIRL